MPCWFHDMPVRTVCMYDYSYATDKCYNSQHITTHSRFLHIAIWTVFIQISVPCVVYCIICRDFVWSCYLRHQRTRKKERTSLKMTENLTDAFNLFLAIYVLAIKPKHMFMWGIVIILHPLSSMVQSFSMNSRPVELNYR